MARQYDDLAEIVLPRNVVKTEVTTDDGIGGFKAVAGPANNGIRLKQWIKEKIEKGDIVVPGNGANLDLGTNDGNTQIVTNTGGTGFTIPAASNSIAGLLSTTLYAKLIGLVNYVFPGLTGDVTAGSNGVTTIGANKVDNSKLAKMLPRSNKVNNTNASNDPTDFQITAGKLFGTDSTGALVEITPGTNLSLTGTTLNASGGSGGHLNYAVSITGGNAGAVLMVTATAVGILASFSSNQLTITIPEGVYLLSAFYKGTPADIQSSFDGGGASNWLRVRFVGTIGNTGLSDMMVPIIQKTIFASGTPDVTAPFTITQSNNPAQAVIGVSANSITIRLSGMVVTNGYGLTFTGFY